MKKLNGFLMKARWVLVSSCLIGLLGLSACQNEEDDPEPVESALVGIYHAVPNANGLDIILNISGTINQNPFEYEDYTGYLNFYPGERTVKLAEKQLYTNVLVDTTLVFVKNKFYSVFVAGSFPNTEALVLEDVSATPGFGKAMIRVVHLSPDTPSLSVLIDEQQFTSNISFKDGTAFQEILAGTLDFELVNEANDVLLNIPSVQVDDGDYLTLVINGYTNPPGENTNTLNSDFIRH